VLFNLILSSSKQQHWPQLRLGVLYQPEKLATT